MGTLFNQKYREERLQFSNEDAVLNIAQILKIINKEMPVLTMDQKLKIAEMVLYSEEIAHKILDGDVKDEQVSGCAKMLLTHLNKKG